MLVAKYYADTVLDLLNGPVNLNEVRNASIHALPVPIGTVSVCQALDSHHDFIKKDVRCRSRSLMSIFKGWTRSLPPRAVQLN